MAWTTVALLSAALFGLVSVVDKRLLTWHMPSVSSYYLWLAISLAFFAVVVLLASGLPAGVEAIQIVAAYGAGLSWGVGLVLLFLAMRREEASRAVAISHIFPVFVALLAVAFLGESLGLGHWLAIAIVVVGALLISLRSTPTRALLSLNRSFPILISASFMIALAHFASKAALDDLPVSTVYVFRNLGMATTLLLFVRPSVVRESLQAVRDRSTALLLFLVLVVLAPGSVALTLLAIDLGPVSLVSTLIATRPFFVFLYSSVLSSPRVRFLDEPLHRETLALKFVSIVLIIGGVSALQLL